VTRRCAALSLAATLATELAICATDSASTVCTASVFLRDVSALPRAWTSAAAMWEMAVSDCCAAPAASSAPLAICSIALRS